MDLLRVGLHGGSSLWSKLARGLVFEVWCDVCMMEESEDTVKKEGFRRCEGEARMNGEVKANKRKVDESRREEEEKPDSLSPRDCRPMSDILNRFVVWGLSGRS